MIVEQVETFYSKLSKNGQLLFIIAVISSLMALMDLLVLGPILTHIHSMDLDIADKTAALKRDLRILSFRDGILSEYKKYQSYLDSGEKTQEQIVSALLNKIESFAKEKSVSISDVQPGDMTESSIFQIYKTSLSGEGKLLDVLQFMDMLEESDYLFRVIKFTLTPKSKGADVMKFTLDIERVLVAGEEITLEVDKEASGLSLEESAEAAEESTSETDAILDEAGSNTELPPDESATEDAASPAGV
ncbi:MAG: hypothetical protein NC930_00040 [Candidatus Omnitrophica bacterium]|nr:hypothetical protein [Candidatus Omnitrophota bacterium]